MGRVMDMARVDAHRFLTECGFENDIQLEKYGVVSVIKGITPLIHMATDTDGVVINSKTAHVSITEQSLIDANVVYRKNGDGEIYMRDFIVGFSDSANRFAKYTVKEQYPDNTLGVIVLQLSKADVC